MDRCIRNLTKVLVVAISAVSTAFLAGILRSTLYTLQKQTLAMHYQNVGLSSTDLFTVLESISAPSTSNESDDQLHLNLVFILDFWERMINIQSGLRRLVNIGVEGGFTVVEPFMYESRVQPSYSDPHHFTDRNMTPQPAMHYFRTEDLFLTNNYISYMEGIRRIELTEATKENTTKSCIIQAAVYFEWPDATGSSTSKQEQKKGTFPSVPFRWCDEKLYSIVASNLGYKLSRTTLIERAVCLSVPTSLPPHFFHSLFDFVRNGTKSNNRRCSKCVALAFMNYRKHAFQGFHSNLGTYPFKQKVPPLEVSAFGRDIAKRVVTELLGKRPYVAIQIRTGKAFTLFENYENILLKDGVNITRYSSFQFWLHNCTRKISLEAKEQRRQLGRRAVYYIASDMFNEGWKGGEKCPEEVDKILDEAKRYLSEELRPIYRFDHTLFGVEQDVMGTSSIADAAVSREADRFLFAIPSNFGRWVAEQRELSGKGGVIRIDCSDERLLDE